MERIVNRLLRGTMMENEANPKREPLLVAHPQPDEARRPEPTADDVRRFRQHVEHTGDPQSFPGVVNTTPPKDAPFRWLTEKIDVPVHRNATGQDICCPWCSPTKPKFKRGRLLWFPLEGVMRFVGHHCASRNLDTDLLRKADAEWREQQRQTQCNAFLRANCQHVERWIMFGRAIAEIARACDTFHDAFAKDHSEVYPDLARYIRDGHLKVDQALGSGRQSRGPTSISVSFGILQGHKVFAKRKPNTAKIVKQSVNQLESVAAEAHLARHGELSHLTVDQRRVAQIIIDKAHVQMRAAFETIRTYQAFLAPENIALLNAWCADERSDVSAEGLSIVRENELLKLGYRGAVGNRCENKVRIPEALLSPLPSLLPLQVDRTS